MSIQDSHKSVADELEGGEDGLVEPEWESPGERKKDKSIRKAKIAEPTRKSSRIP